MLTRYALVTIDASKDTIKFACNGDIGSGSISLRSSTTADKPDSDVTISLVDSVQLTFSLKYLINFCKASNLSKRVNIKLANDVPLLVEYELDGGGHLQFYLAPKVRGLHRREYRTHKTDHFPDWRRGVRHADPMTGMSMIAAGVCRGGLRVWKGLAAKPALLRVIL